MRTMVWMTAVWGCQGAGGDGSDGFDTTRAGEGLADFSLTDVNATSATFDTEVSVASQRGGVSAWYFGHST